MTLPLSLLDLSPVVSKAGASEALRNTVELARLADRLGYTRYWLAEHHNMPGIASVAPEILIGPVAAGEDLRHLRVGSGGIMLPNHAPLKVAETFKVLEALYPGRIDLGIGRAPGTDARTAEALRRTRFAGGEDDFPQQLEDLIMFDTGGFPAGHPFRSVRAVPVEVPLPPIWLLGSSDFSARFAAERGLPFAFAHHIASHNAVESMRLYRSAFRPSSVLSHPYSILTVAVVAAGTDEGVAALTRCVDLAWVRFLRRQSGPLPTVEEAQAHAFTLDEIDAIRARRPSQFLGTPQVVKSAIDELVEETQADEVMLAMFFQQDARLRACELMASVFGLSAQE